ncbi:hypothetical protein AQUCO_01500442v1 [Aquilegia coerulea]|uniref:F-box domain-containing protein n=1 Tax=Aquilegia coerulea TaxID=218851 RepID=A0A2G5DTS5_AQUCA|nr:hypothetical protein AQUCO_01500442v1 [Aquilegia coerulea]
MERGDTKTGDRVSELPEDILSFILSLMSMRDAVQTRVLSRRWKNVSAPTSNLQFDLFTLFGINCDRNSLSIGSDNQSDGKCRFIKAVDQFLHLCRSPKLYSFKVCYSLGNDSECHIDRWISFAVRGHTEKLVLDFSGLPKGCELYNFPCNLLSHGKLPQLKHLCLQSCALRPSPDSTNIFNSLKTLDLNMVPLEEDLNCILSGCVTLEWLRLTNCKLPVSFFICAQYLCLKSLILDECHGAKKIEISRPLTAFEYIGGMTNLSFVGAPSIEKVKLMLMRAYARGTDYMFHGLAKELPSLQRLSLSLFTRDMMSIPENMTKFYHLKELDLIVILSLDFDLLSVISILNAVPCLHTLNLAIRYSGPSSLQEKRRYTKQFYYDLKEVEITGFRDECNALDLVLYVLDNALRLERMIIRWTHAAGMWMGESRKKEVDDLLKEKAAHVELIVL